MTCRVSIPDRLRHGLALEACRRHEFDSTTPLLVPQQSPIAAIFLDAAGTLIHLCEPVGETYARIAKAHGCVVEAEAVEKAFRAAWKALPAPLHPEGHPPPDDDQAWWRSLVARTFQTVSGTDQLSSAFEPMFQELYGHFAKPEAWRLYDDVPPALDLMRGYGRADLYVLSNFDRRLHRILEGLGVMPYFHAVVLSSEVGASKPHPRIFEAARREARVLASACLHIGDDGRCDLEGARDAGFHVALVDRPQTTLLTIAENLVRGHFLLAPSSEMTT